jgi:ATP-dependent DNA ligase
MRCSPAHCDLDGIVGKLAGGRYHADGTSTNWLKIKNPAYTQMTARHELFERPTASRKRRPMLRVP